MICWQRFSWPSGGARPVRTLVCTGQQQLVCCSAHHCKGTQVDAVPANVQRRSLLASIGGAVAVLSGPKGVPAWAADVSSVKAEPEAVTAASRTPTGNIKTVLVVGATGATGSRVVKQLAERGLEVRAGTRDVSKAEASGLQGAVKADVLDPSSLEEAMRGVDAVIITTGYKGSLFDTAGFKQVDQIGTINAVDAARKAGVKKLVLMTSLLTNARAVGQGLNPGFVFLNLFGGVLDAKLEAEKYLRSGDGAMKWVIVRPGGLSNKTPAEMGNVVVRGEDQLFGRPNDPGTAISRDSVAEVLVEALLQPAADDKVFEIVASSAEPSVPPQQWFRL